LGIDTILIVHSSKIKDKKGDVKGSVVVFDDAMDQIKAQKAIAWREVARRIAHEIKNPITPIKLNAQRILRKYHEHFQDKDKEIFTSCMEMIISQVDSLRDLVNEFSKFSRLPQTRLFPGELEPVILEVFNLFRMGYPSIVFEYSPPHEMPIVKIDREQMNRALFNIINNSVSAIVPERKGRITIKTSYLEDVKIVRMEIRDNGCGIPKELKDRVLEPYFSTKEGGTGLGLAIVHQIITDHGGYLRVSDNHPFGTVLIIEIPV
jgi:two-component system nitrogen regulation sensor histidine kinase NtrY